MTSGRPGRPPWRATAKLESHEGETSLTGRFSDQAQLHGLLDRLRDLGISIVSVNPAD